MRVRKSLILGWALLAVLCSHLTVSTLIWDADKRASEGPFTEFVQAADGVVSQVSITPAEAQVYRDPCSNPGITVITTPLAQLSFDYIVIPGTTNRHISVCEMYLADANVSGSNPPTVRFLSGTGVTCGTGTTALTGTFVPGSTLQQIANGLRRMFITATTGDHICVDVGGGTSSISGWMTYVMQAP